MCLRIYVKLTLRQAASTFPVFMLAMTLYPRVMRKAQTEIDKVIGRHRMPTVADREQLPYIEAMVKEALRWRPAGPMGKSIRLLFLPNSWLASCH